MKIHIPTRLSDADLVAAVTRLACCEGEATAQLVAHLAELDARRLHLGAGFSSLFVYCCEVLHLSEHDTYQRIEAARTARRFPVILELLSEGAINLATIRLLSVHLTDGNHRELLAAASHRSKRDVEELVASRFPRPDIAALVRKLPTPKPISAAPGVSAPALLAPSSSTAAAPAPPSRPAIVAPLAPSRYEIRFTASGGTREKLRQAQDLLRHTIPNGNLDEIFGRALTLLLEDLARKKLALVETARPKEQPTASDSRHIPAHVKRVVWLRDGGQCAFISQSGRHCAERGFLEFHHVRPYGVGGEASVDNIQLRCRAHNAYEADLFYGPRHPPDGPIATGVGIGSGRG
jgi:hypothetical protein